MMDAGRKNRGKITLSTSDCQDDEGHVEVRVGTDATVKTDAAKVASDELTDWRELAKDKSTVSIS
jgi:hypothetical protein